METGEASNYSFPVNQLLSYGKPEAMGVENWLNYLELGFTSEHIPELIRLATDEQWNNSDSESAEIWAPVHAWRALGQLHAEAASEPLLVLYKVQGDDDWVMTDLPAVYGLIGPAALPALAAFMADSSNGEWPRVSAAKSIEKIGVVSPAARNTSVEILSKQLASFQETEYDLNGFLITSLMELKAVEAAPIIEQAFAAGAVDMGITGDWVDVQADLGLLPPEELEQLKQRREAESLHRQQEFDKIFAQPWLSSVPQIATPSETYWKSTPYVDSKKKAKQKNKASKQARKKNRKH